MSDPFGTTDHLRKHEPTNPLSANSEMYDREWAHFLEQRSLLVDQILDRLKLGGQATAAAQQAGTDPMTSALIGGILGAQQTQQLAQGGLYSAELPRDWNELRGAADFYGIENPEKIPPEVLRAMIRQRRLDMAQDEQLQPDGFWGTALDVLQTGIGTIGVGMTDAVLEVAQRVPFIGDALARTKTIQDADRWLSMVEEGFRGDLVGDDPEGFIDAVQGIFEGNEVAGQYVGRKASELMGYAMPATLSWKAAGAMGAAGSQIFGVGSATTRLGFVGRAALQGGASAWMLEGGGDEPLEHRALNIALGAGVAGGATALAGPLQSIFNRLRRSFTTSGAERIDPVWWAPIRERRAWRDPRDISEFASWRAAPGEAVVPWQGPTGQGFSRVPDPQLPRGPFYQPAAGYSPELPPGVYPAGQSAAPRMLTAGESTVVQNTPDAQIARLQSIIQQEKQALLNSTSPDVHIENIARAEAQIESFQQLYAQMQSGMAPTSLRGAILQARQDVLDAGIPERAAINQLIGASDPGPRMAAPPQGPRYVGALEGYETASGLRGAIHRFELPDGRMVDVDAFIQTGSGRLGIRWIGAPGGHLDDSLAAGIAPGELGPDALRPIMQVVRGEYPDATSMSGFRVSGIRVADPSNTFVPIERVDRWLNRSAARADGISMSKHTAIAESPMLADMATQPRFDDYDVATAMLSSRPSGVSVVKGVGDIDKFMRQALQNLPSGVGPQDFRVVKLPTGEVDVLVAGGKTITNKMVSDYKSFGMFSGQRAVSGGVEVEIVSPAGGESMATVRNIYSGDEFQVRADQLTPHAGSSGVVEAPALYNEFRNFVLGFMEWESTAARIRTPDWLSSETSSQLPRLMDEFLSSKGYEGAYERGALMEYFERARVSDYRSLAPQEFAEAAAIRAQATKAVVQAQAEGRNVRGIEAAAEQKGFTIDPDPSTVNGLLVRDELSDLVIPVEDEEAAVAFLSEFNRDLPDVSTPVDVPVELIEAVPGGVHPGSTADYVVPPEQQMSMMETSINRAERAAAIGGGDGGGRLPPGGTLGGGMAEPPRFLPETESLGNQFRRLLRDDPQRYQEMLQRVSNQAARLFLPMRNFTLRTEELLHSYGIEEGRIWQQYNRIVTGIDRAHNESIPFYQEINDIVRTFRRRFVRDGTVTRLLEMTDDQARVLRMDELGFTVDERVAVERTRSFFSTIFGEAGMDPLRFLQNYVPHVRARQAAGRRNPFGAVESLPREIQFFAEYAREGNMDFRQMDIGMLMTHWVRAWQFNRHVGEAFDEMAATWQVHIPDEMASIPGELRRVVKDWLHIIRFGHNQEHEFAVQGVRGVLNGMGIPVTDTEIVGFYNSALTNAYRSGLGLRPDVWFRDAIQPLLTGAKIGFGHVRGAYRDFFRNPGMREEMWERALRGGWVAKGMVQVPEADVFTQPAFGAAGVEAFGPGQMARRESFAAAGDLLYDAMPKPMRGGIQGTVLDPLLVYTREGEFNRLISGEAGWRRATEAIGSWRSAGSPLGDGLHQVATEAGAMSWRGPIQREFQRLLVSGADEDAAILLANEAANMQFRYGTREASPGIQSAGMKGRFAMMFGTFTNQYAANMGEMLAKDIPAIERTKFLARYGAVVAAVAGASAATGWNFAKWQWHNSLTFSGGPPLHYLVNSWYTLTGVQAGISEKYMTPQQQTAVQQLDRAAEEGGLLPNFLMGAAETFFPYSGGMRSLENIGGAVLNPGGMETLPQFLMTGEDPAKARGQNAAAWAQGQADAHTAAIDSLLRAPTMPGAGSRQ